MSATPIIKDLLAYCDKYPKNAWYFTGPGCKASDVAAEIRALLTERDAWKAKADAVSTPPRAACGCQAASPPRRLLEYKGVTFGAPYFHLRDYYCASAAKLITDHPREFTDADHAALLALRDDPYEPTPTLESVVQEWADDHNISDWVLPALVSMLRAHLSQQTPPAGIASGNPGADKHLTAAECVERLVELGAELHERCVFVDATQPEKGNTYKRCLILPPEVSK